MSAGIPVGADLANVFDNLTVLSEFEMARIARSIVTHSQDAEAVCAFLLCLVAEIEAVNT